MEDGTYVIKEGDTLTKIAFKNNISIAQIKKLNGLSNDDTLYPGFKIKLKEHIAKPSGDQLEFDDIDIDHIKFESNLSRKRSNSVANMIRGVDTTQIQTSINRK